MDFVYLLSVCFLISLVQISSSYSQEQEVDVKTPILVNIPDKGVLLLKFNENSNPELIKNLREPPTGVREPRQDEGEEGAGVQTAAVITNGVLKIITGVLGGDLRKIIDGSFSYVSEGARPQVIGSYNSIVGITTPPPTTPKTTLAPKTTPKATQEEVEPESGGDGGEEDGDEGEEDPPRALKEARQLKQGGDTPDRGRIVDVIQLLFGTRTIAPPATTTSRYLFPDNGGLFAPIVANLGSTTTRSFLPNLPSNNVRQTTARPIGNGNIPNINNGLNTLLGGVFGGDLSQILSGSFIFAPNRVQNVASNVLDSVFGSNRVKPGQGQAQVQGAATGSGTSPYLPIK